MEPPKNAEVFDTPTSKYWIEENGLVCSITKKGPPQSLEETKKVVEEFKNKVRGGNKCILIDSTYASPSSKAVRDYMAEEMPKITKALAIISGSPLGRMIANLFFSIKKQPYPVKMFSSEKEAREWINQYL